MKFPDMKLLVQDHTWKKNVLTYPQDLLLSISNHLCTGRTEAEAPVLWPPDAKSRITGKDPDAGKDCGQEKGVTEDERAGQHYGCNEHELRLTLRWQGTGSLVCCSPWVHKESDVTVQPN